MIKINIFNKKNCLVTPLQFQKAYHAIIIFQVLQKWMTCPYIHIYRTEPHAQQKNKHDNTDPKTKGRKLIPASVQLPLAKTSAVNNHKTSILRCTERSAAALAIACPGSHAPFFSIPIYAYTSRKHNQSVGRRRRRRRRWKRMALSPDKYC